MNFLDEIHVDYRNKVWYILHPNIYVLKFERKNNWVSDKNCNTMISTLPSKNQQEMTNNVRLTLSVGDTIHGIYN